MTMIRKLEPAMLILMALSLGLNGLFMLGDPISWFDMVPGVKRTGPPNPHLIRDVGLAYLVSAILLVMALRQPAQKRLLVGIAALWITGHALFHIWEWLAGVCTFDQFMTDVPGVVIPALILIGLACLPNQKDTRHV